MSDLSFVPPEYSQKQREEVMKYQREHPEIREVIREMMEQVIEHKPEDPLSFVKEYFLSLKN